MQNHDRKKNKAPRLSKREYLAANAPLDVELILNICGWSSENIPSFSENAHRSALFAVWALSSVEWADALLAALQDKNGTQIGQDPRTEAEAIESAIRSETRRDEFRQGAANPVPENSVRLGEGNVSPDVVTVPDVILESLSRLMFHPEEPCEVRKAQVESRLSMTMARYGLRIVRAENGGVA